MKNTKEVTVALIAIAALLAETFKDGVQLADAATILAKIQADTTLKAKLEAAYADIEQVKEEVKEVTLAEVVEVVGAALPELLKLIEAVKK